MVIRESDSVGWVNSKRTSLELDIIGIQVLARRGVYISLFSAVERSVASQSEVVIAFDQIKIKA